MEIDMLIKILQANWTQSILLVPLQKTQRIRKSGHCESRHVSGQ